MSKPTREELSEAREALMSWIEDGNGHAQVVSAQEALRLIARAEELEALLREVVRYMDGSEGEDGMLEQRINAILADEPKE